MARQATTENTGVRSVRTDDATGAGARLAEQRRKAKRTAIVHALLAAGILVAAFASNLLGYSH